MEDLKLVGFGLDCIFIHSFLKLSKFIEGWARAGLGWVGLGWVGLGLD